MSKRFPGRRLSIARLGIFSLLVVALVGAGLVGWGRFQDTRAAAATPSVFSGYVDVTATPTYAFENPVTPEGRSVVLSFVVADPKNPCQPSWGGAYSLSGAADSLDLDRRIARLVQNGGRVAVSFGGLTNNELATVCTDPAQLKAAYQSVVQRYSLSTIDLDVEGTALADTASLQRRAAAIASLQQDQKAAGKDLSVWLTLPVAPSGLTAEGQAAVQTTLAAGVDLAGVNIMTMDYGASRQSGESMLQASKDAAEATHTQLDEVFRKAGANYGSETLWRKIGLTPMIGQNDVQGEILTLDDAAGLNAYARSKGVGRVSMWSLNRDATCSTNYPDLTRVSDACSGVAQGSAHYATLLGQEVAAGPVASAAPVATATGAPSAVVDDPATSPYPIWSPDFAYVAEDRIVWKHNVYQAKFWTRGDVPNDPIAQGAATPWKLIGPVLPGDRPVPEVTAPAGTYPQWAATRIYNKGDRVMFEGHILEAKWWTQSSSPEAALQGSADSPWLKLKNADVEALLQQLSGQGTASPTATTSAGRP